jgi:hypothetical protein
MRRKRIGSQQKIPLWDVSARARLGSVLRGLLYEGGGNYPNKKIRASRLNARLALSD